MEEAPENGKESLHSAYASGIEYKIQKQYFNSRTHYSSHKDIHDFQLQFYTPCPSELINAFTK
jgi:hypothetical protein